MLTKTKYDTRIQIMVNKPQQIYLKKIAKIESMSISALVRDMIDSHLNNMKELQLVEAVDNLYSEYQINGELTAFTALDGEDFYESRGSMADKP